jgi:2-phospho-L-lactate guanylyltransferase
MVFLLPFKGIGAAKTRWSGLGTRRHELVLKLLHQNLRTVTAIAGGKNVYLVSPDQSSLDYFQVYQGILTDGVGLNQDLRQATSQLKAERAGEAVCVLLPDLPGLTEREVSQLIRSVDSAEVALCPDTDDFGTNALVLRAWETIPFAFEGASFERHLQACRKRGLELHILRSEGLAQDCDSVEDLETFCLI